VPSRAALRAGLAALALACTLLAATGGAGAAQSGVNLTPTSGDYFHSPAVARAITRLRPRWVRVFLGWNALEPRPGDYDTARLAGYRAFFAGLPRGTRVEVDILSAPAWASGSSNPAAPPLDVAQFAAFVAHVAHELGGGIAAYEIGDEEDSPQFWGGSVAQYAALLRAAYGAVKAADPRALVIAGGLTGNDYAYLSALYAAGARGSFDAVAVHTDTACNTTSPTVYAFDRGTSVVNRWYFLGFTSVHAVMAAHGDGAKPIFMTEIGWSSTSAQCATGASSGRKLAGVSAATQAQFLRTAYRCLAQRRFRYVRAAFWFGLFDNGVSGAPTDNYGLLTSELAPKPAFAAFASVAQGTSPLTSCGRRAG
jgi:hypothetical protein